MFQSRQTPLSLAVAVAAVWFAAPAAADDSNRNEVRAKLEKGGWHVVWGKNFTEADWARGTKAIAESVATENPGPFLVWFEQTLQENFTKIERNLQGVTQAHLERWVAQSLKQKKVITYKGIEIEAGFATYDRWQRVVYDEPRTRRIPRPPFVEAYTVQVERRANLPNWHQFYVRYKLVENRPTGPAAISGNGSKFVKIKYMIENTSGRTVRFQMQPSGNNYTLEAGKKFRGTSNEVDGKLPTITLTDSGRTFKLTAGDHKFWWMSKQRRVGFDRETD